ncbi:MAG: molybdopterin molybdotransferase MoeA [Chloroflexi bacterium]|nr:molybdopterin molybdotransferase MoeA [Chloroflexota bacterium]
MPEFLILADPDEARHEWLRAVTHRVGEETVPSLAALGRVLAEDIVAHEPIPGFRRSTVDGYAVRAADTHGASEALPAYLTLVGEVPMGAKPTFQLQAGQAALIHTGGMLPEGADAVVMLEHTQHSREDEVEVLKAVAVGENVIEVGEDVAQGQRIIPAGTRIRAAEVGGLMALGRTQVRVRSLVKVGVISTGDEVVPPEVQPGPGQVRDINSYTLSAILQSWAAEPKRYGIVPDDEEALYRTAKQAFDECDMVVITAGSSASTRDMTATVINRLGEPGVLVHGLRLKPGKPTILGVAQGKPIIGLPGNPVSAFINMLWFVIPALERLQAARARPWPRWRAILRNNAPSEAGREEWIPVRLHETEHGFEAEVVFYKSNLIFRLVEADGLIRVPADATGLPAGTELDVYALL